MKSFAITPLSLLFLLLKFPRSPPSFQETALSAVASQVQHLGKQKHETAVLTSTLANKNMNSDNVLDSSTRQTKPRNNCYLNVLKTDPTTMKRKIGSHLAVHEIELVVAESVEQVSQLVRVNPGNCLTNINISQRQLQ